MVENFSTLAAVSSKEAVSLGLKRLEWCQPDWNRSYPAFEQKELRVSLKELF